MTGLSAWNRKDACSQRSSTLLALATALLAIDVMTAGNVAAASEKTYVFRGKVQSFDSAARTLTLLSGNKAYVFKVTDETKLLESGVTRKFTRLWRGQNAEVTMKPGPNGEGIALLVEPVATAD